MRLSKCRYLEKIKNNMAYFLERFGPYISSIFIGGFLFWKDIDFSNSSGMDNALDGVNTMCALIIGFMGAVIPVILGMKNESKIVKYVFEKDEDRLFLKYNKSAIATGILTVAVTITMYFRNDLPEMIKEYLFPVWVFFVVLFLLLTYRCLNNMLELIFMSDTSLRSPYKVVLDMSEEMNEFKEECKIAQGKQD